ncbi:TetR family transcriptional regulator [Halospina denitrificans]|uniref:TetR family transcriptional regulator n=1 Tax=Halospina denitrificans TaxID=332522 RepID=A0A4R7K2P8_9GAMM|nr:TetR/AcrR family transcriptional regulator [Halospina denitrificans]TDT44213.1 TetR family transcriptional regulator [Halospina denitrificans]
MTGNETREHIIQSGAELILRNGFRATGINTVLDEAGVPKGSFYYYFKSKNDFGLAVIDAYAESYRERLDATLGDDTRTPLERIRLYLDTAAGDVAASDYSKGCLIGNLGQELAAQNDAFRERLNDVFAAWEQRFRDCIAEGQQQGEVASELDPREAASLLLSGWQGALLRSKLTRSSEPLTHFRNLLFSRVLQP